MDVKVNSNIELRDYQEETLQKIRTAYEEGTNRVLAVQATGMGKSVTFAHLPERFPELMEHGMLVIVHTTELAHQAIGEIEWVCPELKVSLEKAEHEADSDCDVVVTSRQTLGRSGSSRLDRLRKDMAVGIVVTDEAHHVKPQGQYDNILSQLGLGTSNNPDILPNGKARLGRDKYRISVPGDLRYHIVIEKNQVGRWEITIHVSEQKGTASITKAVGDYETLEGAIGDAEWEIYHNNTDDVGVLKQEAAWHHHRASDPQKELLDDLGVDYPDDITKGEASQLIDAKRAMQETESV